MVIFCLKMPNFYKVKHVMEELLQIVKVVKDLIIEHKVAIFVHAIHVFMILESLHVQLVIILGSIAFFIKK